ncbi:polysaccharide biosynthesis/export family protein [Paraburkholderia sp. J67]|uniref:polysaccharide biosynthesis/export family protein n=1 Tax=Paraburkholderia sp. J67 TaxID=2805435 RepID=UPI002ABD655E|nr:polysaccharide biosynthesis/export family protein [Paraburkholderia sp. J67]
MNHRKITGFFSLAAVALMIGGCGIVPASGPTAREVQAAPESQNLHGIQVVDVTDGVARRLVAEAKKQDFASTLGDNAVREQMYGPGDSIEVSIWEAPPATLFVDTNLAGDGSGGTHATVLPAQVIDLDGTIVVPFAGRVRAAGRTPAQLSSAIATQLNGKANHPQVIVRTVRNANSYVTVVGDVTQSSRMELSAAGERLLDALANAGGVKHPIEKTTIQVTRGSRVETLPMQAVVQDPSQNVVLRTGDVVTALYQPYSFTVLGATGKNSEVNFETQGISLAQALARSGGLNDARSDPKGVFIFRFEPAGALHWSQQPVVTTPDGRVPVVYRVNLKDPANFFVAQSFPIKNGDVVYVSNGPVAELQKFMNLIFSTVYPVTTTVRLYD